MTEQEFLEIVSLHVETWHRPEPDSKARMRSFFREGHGWTRRSGKALKNINLDDCVMVSWNTGGIGGGSCWDDGERDNHHSVQGEPEPEFVDLDTIIEQICPNITLMQYKKLLNGVQPPLIEHEDWSVNEYYGNCSDYRAKRVSLRRLYERLGALGLV